MQQTKDTQKIGLTTALTIVVASMIGTGVFTSLGFQIASIKQPFVILVLWVVGGITALSGAFSYGELGSIYPHSGGEYQFLKKIYNPFVGFLSGWVSILVGFSAPIAAAAIAAGKYSTGVLKNVDLISENTQTLSMKIIAIVFTLLIAFVHTKNLKTISLFQRLFTILKIVLIVVFIAFGFILPEAQNISFSPDKETITEIFSGTFAVALIFVIYAYSGWNASAYISEEIKNPKKNMPLSLFLGTLIVILLYVPVNAVFLYSTPVEKMIMQEEVAYIAANNIFGQTGGVIMGVLISIGLISSISSMTWTGPRVMKVIGEDYKMLRFFSKKNKNDIPLTAIIVQTLLVLFMIITSTFESIIYYIGFTLTLSSFITVLGVYVLRKKKPNIERKYKTWGYPVTPAIYLIVTGWMMFYIIKNKPIIVLYSVLTIIIGAIFFFLNKQIFNRK